MLRSLVRSVAAATMAALWAGSSFAAEPLNEINISYVESPFNLQAIVMRKQELLEKEFAADGVKINWHNITSGAQQTQAMAAGSLDIGGVMNTTSVLLANAGGNPVLIAAGANLLVDNGTLIAQALGVPESVIALTFVALGTSLPELVTAITSLVKGHSDLSLGNVVGANVFNLVLVSGMSITLAPFTIPQSATLFGINSSLVLDLPVMLAVMLILTVPALVKGKLNRAQGILLLAIYAAFCAVQFTL